jgi:hypothetical protein
VGRDDAELERLWFVLAALDTEQLLKALTGATARGIRKLIVRLAPADIAICRSGHLKHRQKD